MPEIITTPNALVQTTNGKRFYVYSGLVAVTSSETTMISIDNIGERDIFMGVEIGIQAYTGSDGLLIVKSNGATIYNYAFDNIGGIGGGWNEVKLILAANTSLEITLTMAAGSHNWTVACYGKYLSM